MKTVKKMARSKRKQPKRSARGNETLSGILHGTLRRGAEALRAELDLIISGAADENGHDKASRIGHAMRNAAAALDAARKDESAQRDRSAGLTRTDVVAWARDLDVAERAQLVRDLAAIDSGGSVLG